MQKKTWLLLFIFGLLILFPLIIRSSYYQHLMIIIFIWVMIGSSWNLLAGYTGQVSFGHAIFFGVGAYAAGILDNQIQHIGMVGVASRRTGGRGGRFFL